MVSQWEPVTDKPRLPKSYSVDALQAMLRSRSDDGAGR
jgi:hypothetical protein